MVILALLVFPAAAALPVACGADCRINASSLPGYDPAVTSIASGSTVTWHSTDITHVTRDTATTGADECFTAVHFGDEDSQPIRFDIVGGTLTATDGDATYECLNAIGDGASGFQLHYFCTLHPIMRGALVVTK